MPVATAEDLLLENCNTEKSIEIENLKMGAVSECASGRQSSKLGEQFLDA